MRVHEVDADGFETLKRLARRRIGGGFSAYLTIIEWHHKAEETRAVQQEMTAFDPELAEAEAYRPKHVQHFPPGVQKRELQMVHVAGGVHIPQFGRLPGAREREAAFLELRCLEQLALQLLDHAAMVLDLREQTVALARFQVRQGRVNRELPFADRSVHLDIANAGAGGRAQQEHVATEPTTSHLALDLLGRSRIAERLDDGFERCCRNAKRKHMLAAGVGDRRDVHLATRKIDFTCLGAVHVYRGIGIEILGVDCDAAPRPSLGDGNLTLVPRHGDLGQLLIFPARVSVDCLGIFLHPPAWHGPRPRDLVITPTVGGHLVGRRLGRLPPPQAIDADAVTGGRSLAKGLVNVPYCPHSIRQGSGRLPQAKSRQCHHSDETHDNRQKVFARAHSMLFLKSP